MGPVCKKVKGRGNGQDATRGGHAAAGIASCAQSEKQAMVSFVYDHSGS